jgi:hypothetical protein
MSGGLSILNEKQETKFEKANGLKMPNMASKWKKQTSSNSQKNITPLQY